MSLLPFFTYYGGKWRAAPLYPAPVENRIIEPFAGSAGYALRYPDRKVLLCEIDERIFGTWDYLIRSTPDEIRQLPVGSFDHVDELKVCQEARWLIGWWLNKGTTHPCKVPGGWMRGGLRPLSYWGPKVRERIAGQVDAIKHWRVVLGDYRELPPARATWFIDAPYSGPAGRKYGFNRIDYPELGRWCQTRRGQVIVCEAQGADWLPFRPHATTKGGDGHERRGVMHEAIWTHSCDAICELRHVVGSEHEASLLSA